jgi:hypothetical protein
MSKKQAIEPKVKTEHKVNYGRTVEELIRAAEKESGAGPLHVRYRIDKIFKVLVQVTHTNIRDELDEWYGTEGLRILKPIIDTLIQEMIDDMINTDLGVSRITIDETNGGHWNGQTRDTKRRGHWWNYLDELWQSGWGRNADSF